MTSIRARNLGIAAAAVVFLSVFLRVAGDLDWFNLLLAAGGITVIGSALALAIWAQERADTRAGRENMARIRTAEARDAQLAHRRAGAR